MARTELYRPTPSEQAELHLFDKNGFLGTRPLQYLTTVGRTGTIPRNDIELDSRIVSRRHGEFILANGQYSYKDLGSTNGTYINGKLYGGSCPGVAQLQDGDVLSIEIKWDTEQRDKIIGLFTQSPEPFAWTALPLTEDMAELCIGRGAQSSLAIEDPYISEKHASFFRASDGWALIDHKSTNGVLLNGRRLTTPRYLSKFDVIKIADTYFVYVGDCLYYSGNAHKAQPAERPAEQSAPAMQRAKPVPAVLPVTEQLRINIIQRSVVQRFKRMLLLTDINLTVNAGEMVLILGGSGAGKTTFLNAVMGYEKAEGRITYRDTDIYEEYEQMKYEIGFVPQQDLLRSSDTVYHTLSNAAELKLPRKFDFDAREKRIAEVLEQFGLTRERNTLVSKLSGGQRKRLSIAVEFIADPSLFFLDEPDSGLDDVMGQGLMEDLRRIADQGKIVMVITHSPERAAGLFDKVIVLARSSADNSGHLAFYGSIPEAFDFFGVSSFREIVKKINRPDENGEGLADFYIEKFAAASGGAGA